jgi:glutamate racemase
MKIGFMDSGIGGLNVLQQAVKAMPGEEFLYYADSDNVPYGVKPKDEVIHYVDSAVGFLAGQGAGAIVIACNTATSVAIDYIRQAYKLPIIGMEPAVKPAIEKHPDKRILITATPLSIKEEKLHNLLKRVDNNHRTDLLPLPRLVEYAEAGRFDADEAYTYLIDVLSGYNLENYSAIVLGCTHFNYFKAAFRRIIPAHVELLDGIDGTVRQLMHVIEYNKLTAATKPEEPLVTYYISGKPVTDYKTRKFYSALMSRAESMRIL